MAEEKWLIRQCRWPGARKKQQGWVQKLEVGRGDQWICLAWCPEHILLSATPRRSMWSRARRILPRLRSMHRWAVGTLGHHRKRVSLPFRLASCLMAWPCEVITWRFTQSSLAWGVNVVHHSGPQQGPAVMFMKALATVLVCLLTSQQC